MVKDRIAKQVSVNVKISRLFTFLLLLAAGTASAQRDAVENLPKYNHETLHFGFLVGVNSTDFVLHPARDFYRFDTLKAVESTAEPGFNLGIISELRLHDYITLRFTPDLSFASRKLSYYFQTSKDTFTLEREIESTFLNFPLNVKLRSARLNNFGAYIVAGGRYTYDLASQKNVQTTPGQEIVKLKRSDIGYEGGAGVEFFLPYFKFAIEGKLIVGAKNILVKEDNRFAGSIDKLNSKIFMVSLTFEG